MTTRNNVTRFLASKKIPYTAFELPSDEKTNAVDTALQLGVSPEIVFKTIVILRTGKGKPLLALVPAATEVDLKQVALAIGEKKVSLPTQAEAERLTGLQAGGISPLALLNKGFQVLLDDSAKDHPHIHISGGQRGLNIRLPVEALIQLTNARLAPLKRI